MLLEVDNFFVMHDSMMNHLGMDQEHHGSESFGDGWVEINGYSSQHQSPIHEYGNYGFMPQPSHSLPSQPTFARMAPAQPIHTTQHQQLLPLIMPSHPTWPSMLTNPAGYQAAPVSMPPVAAPLKTTKLPAIHAPSPRKTLTDDDRRRMCRYHEENPSVKQTEIGAMFGVERSTVSKVLRQKEKYLFPEDRSLSPVKRAGKGKFPDIDRALANWVRNSQKQGIPLTDAAIKEKARFFAATVGGGNDVHVKTNSTSWLEKFKQKNGIANGKLMRRASETNISDSGSLNPDSAGPSASQTPSGVSPTSPGDLTSPTSLTPSKSHENMKAESLDYVDFGNHYKHSNSQSTTSLSSAFTDTAPSSFSGGPTSPSTPFAFSPDTTSAPFMPSQQSRLPPPANYQRPRSQTFPMLGIDPSYISQPQGSDNLTPKFPQSGTGSSMTMESPVHDGLSQSYSLDSAISDSPALHHRSSNGSMAPPSSTTPNPVSGLSSPPAGSSPTSPTQDDARRALDTLLNYFNSAPQGIVDQSEYLTVLKLTERLRLQGPPPTQTLPGGLHRIPEQDAELGPKNEHLG